MTTQANLQKKVGMNFTEVRDFSPEMPFIDFMKQARDFTVWDGAVNAGGPEVLTLDSDGYPTSLVAGRSVRSIFFSRYMVMPYQDFMVHYLGTGTITFSSNITVVGTQANRIDIRINDTNSYSEIIINATTVGDHLRDISIVPLTYADGTTSPHQPLYWAWKGGDNTAIFNPDWLNKIPDVRQFRPMNWLRATPEVASNTWVNTDANPDNWTDASYAGWANRAQKTDRTWASPLGVPVEVVIDLANYKQMDPWINVHYLSDTYYQQQLATLVETNLDAVLTPLYEWSNEVWNSVFQSEQYAYAQGLLRWPGQGNVNYQYHALKTKEMSDTIKAISIRAKTIHAVKMKRTSAFSIPASFEAPDWKAEDPVNNINIMANVDICSTGCYFKAGMRGSLAQAQADIVTSWLADADGGLTKAFEQLQNNAHIAKVDYDVGNAHGDSIDEMRLWMEDWRVIANTYNMDLHIYEGGEHLVGEGTLFSCMNLFDAMNRDDRMRIATEQVMNEAITAGVDVFTYYVDVFNAGTYGSFGMYENITQAITPKAQAVLNVLNGTTTAIPSTWYAVYQASDGALQSIGQVVANDTDLTAKGFVKIGYTSYPQPINTLWNPTTLLFEPQTVNRAPITVHEIMNKFTDGERELLFQAFHEKLLPDGITALSATQTLKINAFIEWTKSSQAISVDDPFFITNVNLLETYGILAAGRAAVILA